MNILEADKTMTASTTPFIETEEFKKFVASLEEWNPDTFLWNGAD